MEKYKITRCIRFKIEPDKEHLQKIFSIVTNLNRSKENKKSNLLLLIQRCLELPKLLSDYIMAGDSHKLKSNVKVNYRWLRIYTKEQYYCWKKDNFEKRIRICDINYLNEIFKNFFKEWETVIARLTDDCNRPDEAKVRDSYIALSVKKLCSRSMFSFIKEFVENTYPKDTEDVKNSFVALLEEINKTLKQAEYDYLPSQSSGLVIARASLNYYTVNKKQKNYPIEIDEIEKKLKSKFFFNKNQFFNDLNIGDYCDFSLDELYPKLKEYKSKEKSKFLEAVSQKIVFNEIKTKFPLFKIDEHEFNEFVKISEDIIKKSTLRNSMQKGSINAENIKKGIKKLKQLRSDYFRAKDNKKNCNTKQQFKEYLKFCEIYKKIAKERGRLKAQIKGIEKERLDSQQLTYWALILEKGNAHYLILIPKENAQAVYNKLLKSGESSGNESTALYYFESLTYRALRKLCFGMNGNTFLPEIQKELPRYNQQDFGEFRFNISKDCSQKNEPELIAFYQDILKTDYVKKNMALPQDVFDEVAVKSYATLQDFSIALEKCCYTKKRIISEALKKEILEGSDAQIFQITSLDLRRQEKINLKDHTELWKKFWSSENEQNNYNTRLNPEISIVWRDAKKTRIDKYGKDTDLYDPKMHNRFLHEQYTLCTTISENSVSNEIVFTFKDRDKKEFEIKKFNEKINIYMRGKRSADNLWFYGIDTGLIEFATLAVIGNKKELRPFSVYEVKDLTYNKKGYVYNEKHEPVLREKPYMAIQNLSYFLNEDLYNKTFRDGKFDETFNDLFEKKQTAAIDLTTAKLINGKIIINGDISTLLNLKILNAKRKIYQSLIKNPHVLLFKNNEDAYKLFITDEKDAIYQSRIEFNFIKPHEEIINELNKYFADQQKNEARIEEQINNFRRTLAGNMVGVIYHLYMQYPGIISIENLSHSNIEGKRRGFEGLVERPLELVLYRKFQHDGLVPPISDLLNIRGSFDEKKNKNGLTQLGIIAFVDESETSLRCPECNEKAYPRSDSEEYKSDKRNKVFKCKMCGFDNKENPMGYAGLDSNDKIAAVNIAKKGMNLL